MLKSGDTDGGSFFLLRPPARRQDGSGEDRQHRTAARQGIGRQQHDDLSTAMATEPVGSRDPMAAVRLASRSTACRCDAMRGASPWHVASVLSDGGLSAMHRHVEPYDHEEFDLRAEM
jgi:hypothetical protein